MEKVNSAKNNTKLVPVNNIRESVNDLQKGDTVQQRLWRWYNLLANGVLQRQSELVLFPQTEEISIYLLLKNELDNMPYLLLEELSSGNVINDKVQYIRLVQALLVNISDELYCKSYEADWLCEEIEKTLQFLRDFFFNCFDNHYRLSKFSMQQYHTQLSLKLDYWKIKLGGSLNIDAVKESVDDKITADERALTFQQKEYLKTIFTEIESTGILISDTFVREVLIRQNFNSTAIFELETERIRNIINEELNCEQAILLLQHELHTVSNIKCKTSMSFEPNFPSLKQQLQSWIAQEIRNQEQVKNKQPDREFILVSESKIQTSLSVAKLSTIIRLLVADKIIINKSIAPMLRTVSRIFTTLQKDEISFGSLETKYHAPDKNTISNIKEMLLKWVKLVDKL